MTILGILLAVLAIIYLSVKGLHILVAAPLAALILIITNQMDPVAALFAPEGSYMAGLSGFLLNNFVIFLLGAILARFMEESGASVKIGDYLLDKLGTDRPYQVMLAITLVASILTYGGISIFVVTFALVPLARPIFQRLNLNWSLVTIPLILGMSTYTMTTLPGTPSIHNAIPINSLNTSLTAAPVLSLITSGVLLVFGLVYMYWQLRVSLKAGEGFGDYGQLATKTELETTSNQRLPSISRSLAPLVVILATIFIFHETAHIIIIALTLGIILAAMLFRPFLDHPQATLNQGALASLAPAMATSSSVAFGSVMMVAPGFEVIKNAILKFPGNPLVGLGLAAALLSGITGSSSGTIGIVMEGFAPQYLTMGVSPTLIHRIVVIASAVLTCMPQSGFVITFNNITGLSLKSSFKHMFIVCNVGHLLALLVAWLLTSFV